MDASKEWRYQQYSKYKELHPNSSLEVMSEIFFVSKQTIANGLEWVKNGMIQSRSRGPKPKFSEEIKFFNFAMTFNNPTLTGDSLARKILEEFNVEVSRSQINKIRVSQRFKYAKFIPVLNLNPSSMAKRVDFAMDILGKQIDHRKIIFSDEKWFLNSGVNGRCWRLRGVTTEEVCRTKKLHCEKVLVWGAVEYNFKSKLVVIDGSIDSESYAIDVILESNIVDEANYHFGTRNWHFQLDNATPHVSFDSMEFLESLDINILKKWPPYSPDLSAIKVIWAVMARRVEKKGSATKEELMQTIHEVWNGLSYQTINGLIEKFPIFLNQLLETGGSQIGLN
jgi:transposase